MRTIIKWYIEIWADAVERIEERKGSTVLHPKEIKWWLLSLISLFRTLAWGWVWAFIFHFTWPIFKLKIFTEYWANFMLGQFLFPFLPFFLFDYFLVFYKNRYLRYTNNRSIRTKGLLWIIFIMGFPALISMLVMSYLLWKALY